MPDESADGEHIMLDWPPGIAKPRIGLAADPLAMYWPYFARFLEYNHLPFEMLEIHRSAWLKKAQEMEVVIWFPGCAPAMLDEARRKIHLLQNKLKILCYPPFHTIAVYEDKILQYDLLSLYGFPAIPTFVSYNQEETMAKIPLLEYPVVSKIVAGFGSQGVQLITGPDEAARIAREVFSAAGRATFWPYERQKDYVFFQKFQKNEGYDLRVLVIGNHVFGYYRDTPAGDFRASGRGLSRMEALPEDAMRLAIEVARKIDIIMIAVDMLRDPDGRLHIIELCPFVGDHSLEQLHVDGRPGVYLFEANGDYSFREGRYRIQEVALGEFFRREWLGKGHGKAPLRR